MDSQPERTQADILRSLRKQAGMSQGEFAAELGLSQGFIGEMERSEKPIERRTILAAHYIVDKLGERPRSPALIIEEIGSLLDRTQAIVAAPPEDAATWANDFHVAHADWIEVGGSVLGRLLIEEILPRADLLAATADKPGLMQELCADVAADLAKVRMAWDLVYPIEPRLNARVAAATGMSSGTSKAAGAGYSLRFTNKAQPE